jgi:hypothetical protein
MQEKIQETKNQVRKVTSVREPKKDVVFESPELFR